jgi:hypothetical protein
MPPTPGFGEPPAPVAWMMRCAGLALACAMLTAGETGAAPREPVRGSLRRIPLETRSARAERLRRIAERRSRPPLVIVHRGASAFAPENTLAAYAAAMDYGADGCEIDIRRTLDGTLVLFHDDMLDQLTEGIGAVEEVTYPELLGMPLRRRYGAAASAEHPPTLAAVLELARRRAMLLYLDVKERGLEAEIARVLTEAAVWDHVIGINQETISGIGRDPRARLLRFKGPGLYAERRDMDPEAVAAQLALPGEMVMVDDPRVAARVLGRSPRPRRLPALSDVWPPVPVPPPPPPPALSLAAVARELAGRATEWSPDELLALVQAPAQQVVPGAPTGEQTAAAATIVRRAWAAARLGSRGDTLDPEARRRAVAALRTALAGRTLHPDWRVCGLDGALAARSLGLLDGEAVPVLREALFRVDENLGRYRNPAFGDYPAAWVDFRVRTAAVTALGTLRGPAARAVLKEYLALPLERARELAPPLQEEATRALFQSPLTRLEAEELLASPHSAVRGTALLACLDDPARRYEAALRSKAAWAVSLPRARVR